MKKKRFKKQFLIGQIVKTIKANKVHFPYPNHERLGIFTIKDQQFGYRKGIILKLTKHAVTGDKFNGIWWAKTKKGKIVCVDQKHIGVDRGK